MRLCFCRTPFRSPKLRSALPSVVNQFKREFGEMVFERRHLCLLLKTMTSALFARDALSSALHRFSTAYCETGGFSAGHCARHLWHWSKSWAGICGIGWKIAAVFVLIDSVAFGKEMYCSFIFTSLTMWRFACFINVITTLLWGGSVNMILL